MLLPIRELLEGKSTPTCIRSRQTVLEALRLMVEKDYSQLPVINERSELVGLVSQENILRRYFHMDGKIPILDLTVDNCQIPAITLQMDSDISDALARLREVYAVVIVDEDNIKPVGIITDYDIAQFFWEYTQDLLIARNIETRLRMAIQSVFSEEDKMNQALINVFGQDNSNQDMPRKPFERLTFGNLLGVIAHEKNWSDFQNIFEPKEVFENLMGQVRKIRNQLAHLEDEIDPIQRDALISAQQWFDYRPQVGKYKEVHVKKTDITEAKKSWNLPIVGKYDPLKNFLESKRQQSESRLSLTFEDIETLIGQELTESARIHRAWWGNHYLNSQAKAWLNAGWLVDGVEMNLEQVSFRQARSALYPSFFEDLLNQLKSRRPGITSTSKVSLENWLSFSSGTPGFAFGWVLPRKPVLRVELYIDHGDKEQNKKDFDSLLKEKNEIENEIGESLKWDRLDEYQASRISISKPFNINDPDVDPAPIKQWAIEMMLKFVDAFQHRVRKL